MYDIKVLDKLWLEGVTKMYLVPEVKKYTETNGICNIYDYNIVIDTKCSYNIYLAAKDLKKTLNKSGCGQNKVVKPTNVPEKCIYLTFEDKGTQKYYITVDEKKVTVCGESEQALFFGIQTMKQIAMQSSVLVPCLEIEDEPETLNRGYYLDISRGRVPKMQGLKKLVDHLAAYKYTNMQIYIEHTFQWEGLEEIYMNRGFITAEEILELDRYCKERYIELIPSISSCGHLFRLLQSQSYNKYAELADYELTTHKWFESREHHTIDTTNPESFDLIVNMYEQLMPLFSSNKFNICCDETMDLGNGRGKELADKIGKGQMYVDWINKLYTYLKSKGKEVMFWSDVIRDHTDLTPQLPEDIVCLIWEYTHPLKEELITPVVDTGMRCVLCSSAAAYTRFIPWYHGEGYVAYDNIYDMGQYGKTHKVEGQILTDWGDFGHTCHAELRYPIIAYAGAIFWAADGNADLGEFDRYISNIEYGHPEALIILKEMSATKDWIWNNHVGEKWRRDRNIEPVSKGLDPEIASKYHKMFELELKLSALKLNDECREAIRVSAKAHRLLVALESVKNDPVMPPEQVAVEWEKWFEEYAEVWRVDNKESELYDIADFVAYQCERLRSHKHWEEI